MVTVRATARDLAAAGAPFPLPPPHHLLLPHTWPGAADASSARSPRRYGRQVARVRGSSASLLPRGLVGDSTEIVRARLPLDGLLSSPPGQHHENLITNAFVARRGERDGGETSTLLRPEAGGAPGKALV